MSHIPDIRNPIDEPLYKNTQGSYEPKENAYYQGYLNDRDAEFLAGYDYCIETVIRNFFYNLDLNMDEMEEGGYDYQRLHRFNEHYSEYLKSIDEGKEFDLESISDSNIRLLISIIDSLFDYAECDRDEIGTSMIDNMSDDEYDEAVEKYKAGYRNILVKEPKNNDSNQETDSE